MKRLLFIISLLIFVLSSNAYTAFLGQIINNTNEEILIGSYVDIGNIVVTIFDKDSVRPNFTEEFNTVHTKGAFIKFGLKPKSKAILQGLKIPSRDIYESQNNHLSRLFFLNGKTILFEFCRIGDLMEVLLSSVKLRNFFASQQKVLVADKWIPYVINQSILDSEYYSIAIDYADLDSLFNFSFDNILKPDTCLVDFSEIFIKSFNLGSLEDGRVKVGLQFKKMVSSEYLKKVSRTLIKEIEPFKGVINSLDSHRIDLIFYKDINQEDIELIVQEINKKFRIMI